MLQQVAPHLPPTPGFHRPAPGRLLWSGGAQQRTSGREAHNARAFSFPDSSLRGLSGQLLCSRRRLCAALSPVGVALLPPLSSPWACRGHSWSFCTTLARPTPHPQAWALIPLSVSSPGIILTGLGHLLPPGLLMCAHRPQAVEGEAGSAPHREEMRSMLISVG